MLLAVTGCAVEPPRSEHLPSEPLTGPVTLVAPLILSRFGEWRGEGGAATPTRHAGIDIRSRPGRRSRGGRRGGPPTGTAFAGRLIVIGHDGALATNVLPPLGDRGSRRTGRRRGEVIEGWRDRNATAPHLHFGVCRREGGSCSERIDGGWEDPARRWIGSNPCLVTWQNYPLQERRLTYPVPCQLAPAAESPAEQAPTARPGARPSFRPAWPPVTPPPRRRPS